MDFALLLKKNISRRSTGGAGGTGWIIHQERGNGKFQPPF
jgi:hypothetical protein